MASSRSTVDFIVEQAAGAGAVNARAMFGEYGLYCDGVLVALLCDDRLFLKPSDAGRADPALAEEAPPYPGAKPHFVVPADLWEDGERLAALLRATAAALPPPKPKPGRRKPAEPT